MDRITKQLLTEFRETQEIITKGESKDFELFSNYTIISSEYNKTFDINSATVGHGNDTGIDGVAIIVNGQLIEDAEEIDYLIDRNGYLDVSYIFIQSKTSSSLDTSKLQIFYNGVIDFFDQEPKLPRNEDITRYVDISDYILSKASLFKENPKCKTYYTTTAVINENEHVEAANKQATERLTAYNIFEKIETKVIGANELNKLYRKTKSPITSSFIFSNKVILPQIDGVDQAYYGYLEFKEFKKILVDNNDNILSVFDDNVRDFQGSNTPVNSSIEETLTGNTPNLFSVLNNGITIIANSIKTTGNSFTIDDYQIVNGCQSSNVLYNNRNIEGLQNTIIPIKLISTNNEDIKSQITVSTNNQTAIKKEQLSAMSDFQKNLEHYYNSITGDGKLYYERRTKQYSSNSNVIKKRIITLPNQIKSFSSMFIQDPHLVTSHFGNLVKSIGKENSKIFNPDHQHALYYLAGLVYYRMDSLFNSGELDKKYRKVKFYLIMLIPLLASEDDFPILNSYKKVENYCNPIIDILNNESKCKKLFSSATKIIDDSGAPIGDKEALKSKAMTIQILDKFHGRA